MGEAAPNRYYGESADSVVAALEQLRAGVEVARDWSLEATEAAAAARAIRGTRRRVPR